MPLYSKDIKTPKFEIALFVILLISFASAYMFCNYRVNIKLSHSMEVLGSGFKARLPKGENWNIKTEKWEFDYDGNYFFTGAIETISDQQISSVQWRYFLSSPAGLPAAMQSKYAMSDNLYIQKRGILISRGFGVHWALCLPENITSDNYSYYGLINLGAERYAEIEVHSNDMERCNEIFQRLVKDADYSPSPLISRGIDLIDSIRLNLQFSYTVANNEIAYKIESPEIYKGFIISRAKILANSGEKKELTLTDFGFSKVVNINDIIFDERTRLFSWRYSRISDNGQKRFLLMENRGATVEVLDLSTLRVQRRQISQALWPEIFEMYLVKHFAFEVDYDECIVDMLMPQGQIVPVILKKNEKDGRVDSVSVRYTHKPESEISVFFDDDNNIIRIEDTDKNITERIDIDVIKEKFPQDNKIIQDFLNESWRINGR